LVGNNDDGFRIQSANTVLGEMLLEKLRRARDRVLGQGLRSGHLGNVSLIDCVV
jgi:hypothetical protein